jgi:hypothetical protein
MQKYWATFNTDWNKSWDWPKTERVTSAPVAVAKDADKLDVVFLEREGEMNHLGWNPGWTNTWLGGKFLGVPALVALDSAVVEVFGVDQATNGLLYKIREG